METVPLEGKGVGLVGEVREAAAMEAVEAMVVVEMEAVVVMVVVKMEGITVMVVVVVVEMVVVVTVATVEAEAGVSARYRVQVSHRWS